MVTYPEDWKEVQIGDIYQIKRGQVLATNKISSIKNNTNKYPVLFITNSKQRFVRVLP